MMDYLALIIKGIVTPFIILGEMIGWIGKKYWDWIISGIKEAKVEEDWALAVAYWIIHIIITFMLGAFPLLLLLLKSETAIFFGITLTVICELVVIPVSCCLLNDEII